MKEILGVQLLLCQLKKNLGEIITILERNLKIFIQEKIYLKVKVQK